MSLPVLIDCDPGHDDAIALAVAAAHCDLVGVTTVGGNVRLDLTTRNALAVVELLGADVEVHAGAATPRAGGVIEDARHVHGESGLEGATLPTELARGAIGPDAARFIVDATRRIDDLWLVVTGPMTNVAAAIDLDAGLPSRLAGIAIMGGGTFGNVTPVAEFNVHHDPEAAAAVLACGAPIVMCGLDLTHQVRVSDALIARLSAIGNGFGAFAADALAGYLRNIRALTGGDDDAALHDPCAVLALTHPDLFASTLRTVGVETAGELTRGMTVVDRRPWASGGNVRWCERVDAAAALDVVISSIAAAP